MHLRPLTDPTDIATEWPALLPYALQMERRDPDSWPAHEQLRAALAGQILIWLIEDEAGALFGMLATRAVTKASGRRFMTIEFAAGRHHRRWQVVAQETVEAHARQFGCAVVEVGARRGWTRLTADYRPIVDGIFRKEL